MNGRWGRSGQCQSIKTAKKRGRSIFCASSARTSTIVAVSPLGAFQTPSPSTGKPSPVRLSLTVGTLITLAILASDRCCRLTRGMIDNRLMPQNEEVRQIVRASSGLHSLVASMSGGEYVRECVGCGRPNVGAYEPSPPSTPSVAPRTPCALRERKSQTNRKTWAGAIPKCIESLAGKRPRWCAKPKPPL